MADAWEGQKIRKKKEIMDNGLSLSGNSKGWKNAHLSTDLALIWPKFETWVKSSPIPGKLEIFAWRQPCINFSKAETSCEDRLVSSKPRRKYTTERVESISQNILLPSQNYQEIHWNPGEVLFFSAGSLSRQKLNTSLTSCGMSLANCSPQQWVLCLWAGSGCRTVSLCLCSWLDAFGCHLRDLLCTNRPVLQHRLSYGLNHFCPFSLN